MSTQRHTLGLLLLAGTLKHFPIHRAHWQFIGAADGGALHALRQNVLPDIVIGDLDSLPQEYISRLEQYDVPMHTLPVDKDLTDGEAIVDWALQQNKTDTIVIAGGLGNRFDHTLGNVFLLHKLYEHGVHGWVTDGRQRVFLLRDKLTISCHPGDQLSLIPISPRVQGCTSQGLRWPLNNTELHFTSTLSLSNEAIQEHVCITARKGLACVVVTPSEKRTHTSF